ncbi:MAG: right-handed parallel beta-helix repeat-containing protein [Rikenellaceae bacterium]
MNKISKFISLLMATAVVSCSATPKVELIEIAAKSGDVTLDIRNALESATSPRVKISLQKGIYSVAPTYAFERYCAVTNHNNGSKKIVFPISGFESVEIEGNGATLLCEGQLFPLLFEDCGEVKVSNLTIDWKTPFLFYGEVMAVDKSKGWIEIKPLSDPRSWSIKGGKISFPNSHGFNFHSLGASLPFDTTTKGVVDGAIDCNFGSDIQLQKLANGNVRIDGKMKKYPPIGSTLNSKGDKALNRYAPAFNFKECQNITLDGITIHHALGMGFLFERSEDIRILNSQIVLPPNSKRVVATTADATHFANCKGNILIDGCRFENMLDDGTNVHGTYLEVTDIVDTHSVNVSLKHYQQLGFNFAQAGDEMWFIMQPSPKRTSANRVKSVRVLNETIMTLTFDNQIPTGLKAGDCVENKTWNPIFTMSNCVIRNHRARGIVVKSPLKTVIKNNTISSMMSGILLRGETHSWFESGAVEDVLIEGNTILNSANCGTKHAALYITPRLGKGFDNTEQYDKNIRFVNNTIDSFNPRIVIADRVDGLLIEGNKIIRNTTAVTPFPNDPLFELINCKNVVIEQNNYTGSKPTEILRSDESSRNSLKMKNNKNL